MHVMHPMGFLAGRNEVKRFSLQAINKHRWSSATIVNWRAVQFRHVEVVNKRVAGTNAPFDLKGTAP